MSGLRIRWEDSPFENDSGVVLLDPAMAWSGPDLRETPEQWQEQVSTLGLARSAVQTCGTAAYGSVSLDDFATSAAQTTLTSLPRRLTVKDDVLIDDHTPTPPLRVRTLKARIKRVGCRQPRLSTQIGFPLFGDDE